MSTADAHLRPSPDATAAANADGRRLHKALVMSPLLIGNAVMLILCLLAFQVLSATRAYVGGQALWSKGREQAIQHLREYARSGDATQLRAYEQALDGPLGDHEARLEMDKREPDREAIVRGLLRGGNSPDDIPGMIRLYRNFSTSELMADAVRAWQVADDRLLVLQDMSRQLQQLYGPQQQIDAAARTAQIDAALRSLDTLEPELRKLEQQFSAALGEASRSTFRVLSVLLVLAGVALTLAVLLIMRQGLVRQRRYELALEDANRRWNLAAEGDGLGLFEWRLREDLVAMDANARAAYGLDADPNAPPVPRERLRALTDPADVASLRAELERVIHRGHGFHLRYRIRPHGAESEARHVEVTSVMRGAIAAGDRRMIGIVRDVSARVRQERAELDRATAERTAGARMEFLSRLSHELRTPLNAVLGFADLLVLDNSEPLTPRQLQRVQLVTDAGRHLLHLVDDVLDISGIDSGRLSVERSATPLAPVLAAAAALTSPEQQEFGVRLELPDLPPDLAVWSDARRLGQVLANLLSNGFKYNRPGGSVRVEVRRTSDEGGRHHVRIEVHDQGPGLDDAQQQQLFQAFKRLPGASHRRGTGLGLTIVKLLVEQMGGRIEVRSVVGEGSVFSITLETASA
ncbi:HAMP domain-containing sensor histidine kinase [Paucibacter sp. R3-3]|uniref:histidine kinase n=1 Tax=Roseateles agri TaxID=3098619 RepID=A0ABU5DGT3_9BURK|nr:HAMP domain-containing sensor histidine kinase [Paucibacter sp. R3-3]MDY0744948.1 HAMP domain-containing sensor histidine kinase [Paucibacter sp. R3-3]